MSRLPGLSPSPLLQRVALHCTPKWVLALAAQAARQGQGTRLQAEAFEAINEVVRCASSDTLAMVGQLIPLMINKLNETLAAMPDTAEASQRQSEVQARVPAFPLCTLHAGQF